MTNAHNSAADDREAEVRALFSRSSRVLWVRISAPPMLSAFPQALQYAAAIGLSALQCGQTAAAVCINRYSANSALILANLLRGCPRFEKLNSDRQHRDDHNRDHDEFEMLANEFES